MISYKCSKCGAELETAKSMAGQEDKCPLCGDVSVVPQPKNPMPLILGIGGAALGLALLAVIIFWPEGKALENGSPPNGPESTPDKKQAVANVRRLPSVEQKLKDDKQLHFLAVDDATNKPLPGVLFRLLPEATVIVVDANKLDEHTPFVDSPIWRTGSNGCVTMNTPISLGFYVLFAVPPDTGYGVVAYKSYQPFAGELTPFALRATVSRSPYSSSVNIHDAYLPPVRMLPLKATPHNKLDIINMEVSPRVVLPGEEVKTSLKVHYHRMPRMEAPELHLNGSQVDYQRKISEKGYESLSAMKTDSWTKPGIYTQTAKLYLGRFETIFTSAAQEEVVYVVENEHERASYERALKYREFPASRNKEVISGCELIVAKAPGVIVAWEELCERLQQTEQWHRILKALAAMPEKAKSRRKCVVAWMAAMANTKKQDDDAVQLSTYMEAMLRVEDLQESMLKVIILFALDNKNYAIAQKAYDRVGITTGLFYAPLGRALKWLQGQKTTDPKELPFVANALWSFDHPVEALEALERIPTDKRKDAYKYYDIWVLAHIELERWDAIRAFLKSKPLPKLSPLVLATYYDKIGDYDKSLEYHAKTSMVGNNSSRPRTYRELLLKRLAEKYPADAKERTAAAYSLLYLHDFKHALSVAEKAIELDPKVAESHVAKGLSLEFLGRFRPAYAALKTATQLRPNNEYIRKELDVASMLTTASPQQE